MQRDRLGSVVWLHPSSQHLRKGRTVRPRKVELEAQHKKGHRGAGRRKHGVETYDRDDDGREQRQSKRHEAIAEQHTVSTGWASASKTQRW